MYVTDFLDETSLALGACAATKQEAIDQLVELMGARGNLADKAAFRQAILDREALGSTGIAEGIAIPHAKHASVKQAGMSALVVPEGVDFMAKDGQTAKLLFMIAAPDDGTNLHVEMLGRLALLLLNRSFREKLLAADSKEKFITYIDRMEAKEVSGLE